LNLPEAGGIMTALLLLVQILGPVRVKAGKEIIR
jgi:hypothetical protein